MSRFSSVCALLLLVCHAYAAAAYAAPPAHAVSSAGQPKYGPGFSHFAYADPDAPKGGELRQSATGRFNNLNPFSTKGIPPAGWHYLADSLTVAAEDDPFTQYGLVAVGIEMADDRSWIAFHLDPRARFHDKTPITAHDVAFTYQAMSRGFGNAFRRFFHHVESVETLGERTIRFNFKPNAPRSLPFILGQLPIYPAHFWDGDDLEHTTLTPPLGSGPYRVKSLKPGREIIYERVTDYWAKDHPVRRGQFNFDIVRFDYYRDATVALEAFKAGLYDIRQEHSAKVWATLYSGPSLESGEIVREEIKHEQPLGIQGFFFNIRRPVFRDWRVRRALLLAFDYEWVNRKLLFGQYPRNSSFFTNSELAARGPAQGRELALLEPFRSTLPPELFKTIRSIPSTPGDGFNRENLLEAARLLEEAGYDLQGGRRIHRDTGQPLEFRLVTDSTSMRRIAMIFGRQLQRLGVDMQLLLVDSPQFIRRLRDHDYDMVASSYGQMLIPGQEQMLYWHSSAAQMEGGRNLIGLTRPDVDALTEALALADSWEETVAAGRALDRVLMWGDYVIPLGGSTFYRVAWWDRFGFVDKRPGYGLALDCWWEKKPLNRPTTRGDG
ncbi:extracellular solute-binding protein [Pseudodesulfovibrio alkaliphilus]|nr:extracellular solute-binding protein [Pseudodesulfovibrio alkaliphilus]